MQCFLDVNLGAPQRTTNKVEGGLLVIFFILIFLLAPPGNFSADALGYFYFENAIDQMLCVLLSEGVCFYIPQQCRS